MVDDSKYDALERAFAEFSKRVSKSLETIGKELDAVHKRLADGEAASVRTSSDLGTFKELVRDDLEELDDRVDDALFTPSHYGPAGEGDGVTSLVGNARWSSPVSGKVKVSTQADSNVLVFTEEDSDSDSGAFGSMKIGVYYV